MKKTITRFAPSPTGYIHIGNVRSAIYPYLIARQNHGTFILRIEDTDQARYVEGATELIEDTLNWLGLEWDEGPIVGGPNAPYFQTERKAHYLEWAKKLILAGRAYIDPTPSDQIDQYRAADQANKVPYLYRNHRPTTATKTPAENLAMLDLGHPIRFKTIPKDYQWHDEVMGDLKTGPEVCDDIILIKTDGLPTSSIFPVCLITSHSMRPLISTARSSSACPTFSLQPVTKNSENAMALNQSLNIATMVFCRKLC